MGTALACCFGQCGHVGEMLRAARSPGPCVAFRFPRRDLLLGRWIKHVQLQRHSLRFMRPDAVRYERRVHPVCHVRGPVGQLNAYLDHFPTGEDLPCWPERLLASPLSGTLEVGVHPGGAERWRAGERDEACRLAHLMKKERIPMVPWHAL